MGVNGVDCGLAVFLEQGIRNAVGEIAVRFMLHFYEATGQMLLQKIYDRSSAAVARIAHDSQWLQRFNINVFQKMLNIGWFGIHLLHLSRLTRCGKVVFFSQALDIK